MDELSIIEVGPRDGLQNEARTLTLTQKMTFVDLLETANLRRIESVSFARPDKVPQMADSDEVARLVARRPVRHSGLVMNARGYNRAVTSGLREINIVVLATDTFSLRNQGMPTASATGVAADLIRRANADAIQATITIGAAFGCPFEGETPPGNVFDIAQSMLEAGVAEICLADTIGVGVPRQVRDFTRRLQGMADVPLRYHFHDTRNTAIANANAALEGGVTALDASAGGIGGCPFAPAATGNLATEDLIYLAERSGFRTGVDFDAVVRAARFVREALGNGAHSSLTKAGSFP